MSPRNALSSILQIAATATAAAASEVTRRVAPYCSRIGRSPGIDLLACSTP